MRRCKNSYLYAITTMTIGTKICYQFHDSNCVKAIAQFLMEDRGSRRYIKLVHLFVVFINYLKKFKFSRIM